MVCDRDNDENRSRFIGTSYSYNLVLGTICHFISSLGEAELNCVDDRKAIEVDDFHSAIAVTDIQLVTI